jgi:hypothetical protein
VTNGKPAEEFEGKTPFSRPRTPFTK